MSIGRTRGRFEASKKRLDTAVRLGITPTERYMETGEVESVPKQLELPLDISMANELHTHRYRDVETEI